MPHALGHLWGEGQKYVPKKAYFLVHSFIFPIISVMESAPLVKKNLMLAHSVPIPKGISANWKAGPGEDGKDGEIM